MSVVDDNLGFLYPRHLELAGKQRWDSLSPVAPELSGGSDRCVFGELAGAIDSFWPEFAGLNDPLMDFREATGFRILDNMIVQKICDKLKGIHGSLEWYEQKKIM